MEKNQSSKVTNKLYIASGITSIINSALAIVITLISLILFILIAFVPSVYNTIYDSFLSLAYELGLTIEEAEILAIDSVSSLSSSLIYSVISLIPSFIVSLLAGIKLIKMSKQTDEQASKTFRSAIIWTVMSFLFAGYLPGGLALGGLLSVHKKQKNRFSFGYVTPEQQVEEEKQESKYSEEDLEKMMARLEKLEALKERNAITEEEYNSLRDQIIGKKEKE